MALNTRARLIAYYLPQFHPLPENDKHWGKGFTEWTNVAKAKPLFKGHYQPHLPTELGYYDLRVPEVRKEQADLAREYGIEGFCYWHYWFGGKRVLERPFEEVVKSGEPDFPFCLCWANHSWSAIWVGDAKKIIFEQTYPGKEDWENHFYALIPAFKDPRYIKVDGKLLFSVFAPKDIPDCKAFTDAWRELAKKEGIDGFHFIGMGVFEKDLKDLGLDASTNHTPHSLIAAFPLAWKDKLSYRLFGESFTNLKSKWKSIPKVYEYHKLVESALSMQYGPQEYPVAIPNWDHSPRSGKRALVFQNSNPTLFGKMLEFCVNAVQNRKDQNKIVFLKAWNEWAEGNYLEPEKKFGRAYLEEIKRIVSK
ncbi:MAG: glycoside hydrolase family 99-like domain-containing protein [Opitutaceae bacterium]|nr:glycoside hydrolase family 99-like domain-containing protein [Cytophagales bacterium]